MIPDMEQIVSTYLRADAAVAAIVGDRVGAEPPSDTDEPWVRVTQIADPAVDGSVPDHLIAYMVQFDCYAGNRRVGGHKEASQLTRTVRSALVEMNLATHTGAVVSGVAVQGAARVPDTEFEPARQRFPLTVTIYAHAV